MKKVLAAVLAAAMAMSTASAVFAATVNDYNAYTGSITISGGKITGGCAVNSQGAPIKPTVTPNSSDSTNVWSAYGKALVQYNNAVKKYNDANAQDITVPDISSIYNNAFGTLPTVSRNDSVSKWNEYFTRYDKYASGKIHIGGLSEPLNPKSASSVNSVNSSSSLYNQYLLLMTNYNFTTTSNENESFNWTLGDPGNTDIGLSSDSSTAAGEYFFDLDAASNNKTYSITDINKANRQPEDIVWAYASDDNDSQSIFLIADASADKPKGHVKDGSISVSMKTILKNTTMEAIGSHLGRKMGNSSDNSVITHTVPSTISQTTSGLQTIDPPVINYSRNGNNYVGTPLSITVPSGSGYVLQNYIENGRLVSGGNLIGDGQVHTYDVYKGTTIKLPAGSVITVINPSEYFGSSNARGDFTLYEMKVESQAKPSGDDLEVSDYTIEVDYKSKVVKIEGQYGYSNVRDVESGDRYIISESPRRNFDKTGSVFNFSENLTEEVRIDCNKYVDMFFKGNYGTDYENLRVVTDGRDDIEKVFGDYDIDYYDFVGRPKFARDVTCIIDADSQAFIYEYNDETQQVTDITDDCVYESDGFKFKRKKFYTYVITEEPYKESK